MPVDLLSKSDASSRAALSATRANSLKRRQNQLLITKGKTVAVWRAGRIGAERQTVLRSLGKSCSNGEFFSDFRHRQTFAGQLHRGTSAASRLHRGETFPSGVCVIARAI